jgi:nitrite reductase/ring-hydroxylating ferredoxin subunit
MDLPDSVAAIGERLGSHDAIVADAQLFEGADVFAAERERLFMRPWIAVDHASRIAEPARFFRFEAATRSFLVTRDAEGRLFALRNVCIHAGYPVCEAEDGPAERLVCPYHGWEFAADGRLVEPDLRARIDPARLRLASHPVCVRDGLVMVDPSQPAAAGGADGALPAPAGGVPDWLAVGRVTRRARYSTEWNWKPVLHFVKSSPQLFCDDAGGDDFIAFGPLSLMLAEPHQATLVRVVPRSAARTEIQLVRMAPPDAAETNGSDRLAEALPQAGAAAPPAGLDREFFAWYWSLMSAA